MSKSIALQQGGTGRIHQNAAVGRAFAFIVAAAHARLVPSFDPLTRAIAMTFIIVVLDAFVVAPVFERSYAMFRSVIGTWAPFVAIFAAALAAGILTPG